MQRKPNTYGTRHTAHTARLARLEGQVRGIRRMVGDGAYCIDILTQIQATRAALHSLALSILRKHLECCVCAAARKGDAREISAKLDELARILRMNG